MTITIGLWGLPFLLMVILFAWALLTPIREFGPFCYDPRPLLRITAASFLSLVAWLIWALFR